MTIIGKVLIMIAFSRLFLNSEPIIILLGKINLLLLSAKCLGYNLRIIGYNLRMIGYNLRMIGFT